VKHLRSISEIGPEAVTRLLDLTDHMVEVNQRPNPKVPALRGRTICNLFFEDSTRTRLSFETAAKRLSADVMTFTVGSSSVNKGESLRDTIETVAAMGVDAFVIRHKSSGVPWQVSRWTTASIINGGDGWHAHPTQALLDAYTVRSAFGRTGGLDVCVAAAPLGSGRGDSLAAICDWLDERRSSIREASGGCSGHPDRVSRHPRGGGGSSGPGRFDRLAQELSGGQAMRRGGGMAVIVSLLLLAGLGAAPRAATSRETTSASFTASSS
jgi:hypothetical protein